ncbi:hypothetical protein C9374_000169 [Naegleria lovaniensis]|uniref:Uncharacterized protein n=1 Tax=Naegleria lovaniensis TaxID=51637 RepID=A0AA88GTR7_NAELO|nr:uncharacterized protein C9374_000169 [Naegleria lovaniensis]KAG2388730.1 hypothetical protein C9374_000169 [Naegleria lovaniensis]
MKSTKTLGICPTKPKASQTKIGKEIQLIINKWEESVLNGGEILTGLERLLIEEDYMESPYWGVFQHGPKGLGEVLKEKVTKKVYSEILDSLVKLQNIIYVSLKGYLQEIMNLVAGNSYDGGSTEEEKLFQSVIDALQNDFTMKELILGECKKMSTFERKEYLKQMQDASKHNNESQSSYAMSNSTMSFYVQSWNISPYLERAKSIISR